MYQAQVYVSPDNQTVAERFAEWMVNWVADQKQEKINIALSGGSTPKVLFQILAAQYRDKMQWEKVHFFWGDERCVPPDHSDSNFKMTNDLLFKVIDFPATQIHRVIGENDPTEAAADYIKVIKREVPIRENWPIFDLIILGMGSDGHTASIFPHQMELLHSEKWCEVATHPESGQKRVTLTGKVINQARQICFLVTGDSKKEKVFEIFKETGAFQSYPAYHIRPSNGQLSWNMDEAAVALLK